MRSQDAERVNQKHVVVIDVYDRIELPTRKMTINLMHTARVILLEDNNDVEF